MPQPLAVPAPRSMPTGRATLSEVAAVQRALASSPYRSLQRVEVQAHGDHIVLRGEVNSFYLKQLAQVFALKSVAQATIFNCLDVVAVPAQNSALT